MGFLDTVKGWFNIGGVKVKLQDVNPLVSRSGAQITDKVLLSSKGDRQVLRLAYKFVLRKTSGQGSDRKSSDFVLAEVTHDTPFEIKTGENKTVEFAIPYTLGKRLQDARGVLGAVAKWGSFRAASRSSTSSSPCAT